MIYDVGACALIGSEKNDAAVFGVTIGSHDWELFSLRPTHGPFKLAKGKKALTISNLGLVGKMTGAVAIVRQDIALHIPPADSPMFSLRSASQAPNASLRISTTLKTLGRLGIWVDRLDLIDLLEDTFVLIEGKPAPFECVSKSTESANVLEIDVEAAWKQMGLSSGYSNQADVEVFLS